MSTRLTQITAIRVELQETTPGFWADSELQRWWDDANAEITIMTKQESTSTLTLVASTESYSLPADFYLTRRVEMQSTPGSTDWFEVQPYNLDLRQPGDPTNSTTLTSTPSGYYIFAGKIYFIPIPDQAYSGTLFYYKNAVASTLDTDTPSYPEGIAQVRVDRAIFFYVCAQALRKRQDSAYTTYASDYNGALGAITRDALERGSSAPLLVHDDWAEE